MQIDVGLYYEKYGPMVLRRCKRLLKDENRACEAMQDTFVNLLSHQDSLTAEAPSSLLFKMSTRVCLNYLRKKEVQLEPGEDPDAILEKIVAYGHLEQDVLSRDFLSRLFNSQSESTSVMAVLFYLDEMTLEEVAQEVGMSVSGVRKRLKAFNQKVKLLRELQ